jgi:hypothetical protein
MTIIIAVFGKKSEASGNVVIKFALPAIPQPFFHLEK